MISASIPPPFADFAPVSMRGDAPVSLRPVSVPQQLRQTHLFSQLDEDDLVDLARECEGLDFEAGDTVIRQGEPGEQMFLVHSGRLAVEQQGADGREVRLGVVHKGEYFGEGALLDRSVRMASVRALERTRVLSLSRANLEAFFQRNAPLRESLLAALQHRLSWARARQFRPSTETVLQILADATGCSVQDGLGALEQEVEWMTLPRGDILMRQGEAGDSLFFIVSGRLRVFGGPPGGEVSIAELGPGETVGEMSLLSEEPRSASVSALRDTELLRLSREGFDWLIAAHPRVMAKVARALVDRLACGLRARSAVTQLRSAPLATPEDCDEITRTENLVLRNLKITQMYHRLSLEMTLLIGHQDANWCTFACNASKTAGYSIRGEELPLVEVLNLLSRHRRGSQIIQLTRARLERAGVKARIDQILDAVSVCISSGNLKVFAEIAPIFARFIQKFCQAQEYDRARLERFRATLRPGPSDAGGQDLLAEAMTHYHDAMFEPSPKRKAELILLANAKVGLHEQTRLQPDIVDALNAPIQTGLGGALSGALLGSARRALPARLAARATRALDAREQELLAQATAVWRRLVTRSMMTLRLPYGKVYLGRDMPRLPSEELFPDVLQRLELPELVALVKKYDYTQDDLTGSGASDWGYLPDRMNFILDLFRSRQKSLELFDQPFLYQQRIDVASNRVPAGRL